MNRCQKSLKPIAVFVLAAAGCGGTSAAEGLATDDSELLGAPIDHGHTFDVGICSGALATGGDRGACSRYECSGTLVAPNVVLTAQHCISRIAYADDWCASTFTGVPWSNAPVRVTTSDSTIALDPKWHVVADILVPSNNLCHDDVALLILRDRVPVVDAAPVPMALGRSVVADPPKTITVVGRGVIRDVLDLNTGVETKVTGDLRRRIAEYVSFDCASDTATGCEVVDYSSPPTNRFTAPASYFVLGPAVASGDSGSGISDADTFPSFPRVLGVTSAGTWAADGTPNHALISRLDIHRAFLLDGLRRGAEALAHAP